MLLSEDSPFVATLPFMNLVPGRHGSATPLAYIVGIPFDCGSHPFRVGARQGPDSIREQSRLLRPYDLSGKSDISNPAEYLRVVDAGNIKCPAGDIDAAFPLIELGISAILDKGAIPISMGGDGAVTLPQLRAVANRYPDLVVLHFDAHTDTYPIEGYNTATTFARAAEEQLVDVGASFHIGARGMSPVAGVYEYTRSLGYSLIPFNEFDAGQQTVLDDIKKRVGNRPVYLCFDMDIFDPSCAPGVCTPEWGGLTAKEGLALLRSLSGLNFVAFDVNTVSPPQDIGGMTAFLAATVIQEFISLAAITVRGVSN